MCCMVSAAPVTQNISYQGMLTNAAGNPLTGTYTVTFNLYEALTGGSTHATDTHAVQASKGLYNTQITTDPLFFDGRAFWLGVKVGSDPEMTPRQELRPVPYALSLRPGAMITSSDSWPVLNLVNYGIDGNALNAYTSGSYSDGVDVYTTGKDSIGVRVMTVNTSSSGVVVSTWGYTSDGVNVSTGGDYSYGVVASTTGFNSHGVVAQTTGSYSSGVSAYTNGSNSKGLYAYTNGPGSYGVSAETTGTNSQAVHGHSTQDIGVGGYSDNYYGVYGHTTRSDQKYGIYTPDYLYAKGTQVPAADVAEYMLVSENVSPGTVLIIGKGGILQPSVKEYDTHVAGIVSTAPGVSLGTKEAGNPGEALIAVAGKVPCKVDASKGPIDEGDLLTTSDNPGYAMKATNPQIGTILGKAMGTLESGTGTIEVLVTLQ